MKKKDPVILSAAKNLAESRSTDPSQNRFSRDKVRPKTEILRFAQDDKRMTTLPFVGKAFLPIGMQMGQPDEKVGRDAAPTKFEIRCSKP